VAPATEERRQLASPRHYTDQPFLMPIEDVFGIKDAARWSPGRIGFGLVKVGETVEIAGTEANPSKQRGDRMACSRSPRSGSEWAGDNVGCLVAGVERGPRCSGVRCWPSQPDHPIPSLRPVSSRPNRRPSRYPNGYRP